MTSKTASTLSRKKPSDIFKTATSFSSFSVNDLKAARDFYSQTLGLDIFEKPEGLELHTGDNEIFIYPKPNHAPATFTILNFPVKNIEETVIELTKRGVPFEHYDQAEIKTDDQGIHRGAEGPTIAWFKDPAGNILSVIEEIS